MRTKAYIKKINEAAANLLNHFNDIDAIQNYLLTESKVSISNFLKEKFSITWHTFEIVCYEVFNLRRPTPEEISIRMRAILSKKTKQRWDMDHDNIIDKRNATLIQKYGRTDVGQFGSIEFTTAMIEKYGVPHAYYIEGVSEKIKQTNIEKYGVDCYLKTPDARDKCKEAFKQNHDELIAKRAETNLLKYGESSYAKTVEFKIKNEQTRIEHFGVEDAFNFGFLSDDFKNMLKETFGVSNVSQLDEIKEKKKQTCLDHFGVDSYAKTDEYKEIIKNAWQTKSKEELAIIDQKHKDTCLDKYGVEYYTQTLDYFNRRKFNRYKADNLWFDSFPELCFYLYNKSLNINITRNPVRLEYEFNNKKHYYFPDFQVNEELVEIKGDHLYKKMCIENTCDNAKLKCLMQHKVKILLSNEYKKYIDWFYKNNYKKENYIV